MEKKARPPLPVVRHVSVSGGALPLGSVLGPISFAETACAYTSPLFWLRPCICTYNYIYYILKLNIKL